MLVNNDADSSDELSSSNFWKSNIINTRVITYIKPKKPTYKKNKLKILNLNYNNSHILFINEKTKASKKTISNSR
jgi:hypothetical protein